MMNDSTKGATTFTESRIPYLSDGDYKINIKQELSGGLFVNQEIDYDFIVAGPRFSLSPTEINSVFPAPNSMGNFSTVFPHVLLKRTTLPWERKANAASTTPWLGLLVIDQQEMEDYVSLENSVLSEFLEQQNKTAEKADQLDAQVNVMTISNGLLSEIYPRLQDLNLLSHVRELTDDEGENLPEEFAVVVGNRLPKANSRTQVFLVSFEDSFDEDGNFISLSEENTYLPVLYNWAFETGEETDAAYFAETLTQLNKTDLSVQLANSPVEQYTNNAGFLVLPHNFRNGQNSISFYRGPVGMPLDTPNFQWPVKSADKLLLYDQNNGMFVASYAAAWELGRLLALKNKAFSGSLYEWKRKQMLLSKSATQALEKEHLPIYGKSKLWNGLMNAQLAFFRLNRAEENNRVDNELYIVKGGIQQYSRNNTFGNSLQLDGNSTYVNADTALAEVELNFTLSFWIQNKKWNENAEERSIVSYSDSSIPNSEISLRIIENSIVLYTASTQITITEGNTLMDWMHLAMVNEVVDDRLKITVYLNGEEKTISYTDSVNYNKLNFGKNPSENSLDSYIGEISNFRLFNKSTEVKELDLIEKADLQGGTLYPFFNQLLLLKGVPFNYLIPDEKQFPLESIAFSKVDTSWVQSLIDGAFSIGRTSSLRLEEDQLIMEEMGVDAERDCSVLMIRSASLQSWKDAIVEGYSTESTDPQIREENRLSLIRREMLSDNFLICLFEGTAKTVSISQKGATIHFGVEKHDSVYSITLRDNEAKSLENTTVPIVFYNAEKRVMNCEETGDNIKAQAASTGFSEITSSVFALELIEGVQKVEFSNLQNQ